MPLIYIKYFYTELDRDFNRVSRTASWSSTSAGVALVRTAIPDPVAVPAPSSIVLLTLGLIALCYRRRQMLGR